jgi:hypothetical protein
VHSLVLLHTLNIPLIRGYRTYQTSIVCPYYVYDVRTPLDIYFMCLGLKDVHSIFQK